MEVRIIRAGKLNNENWPIERLEKMVNAYDPKQKWEAPVVIGHRWSIGDNADELSHGWVKALRITEKGEVYAELIDLSPEITQRVRNKQLKYISAEIMRLDQESSADAPYLRAIAFLGRSTPAVATAKIPTSLFSLFAGDTVEEDVQENISCFYQKLNSHQLPEEEETVNTEPTSATESVADLQLKLQTAEEKNKTLEVQLAAQKQEHESTAYFSTLSKEGKVTPAELKQAVAFDITLNDTQREEFRKLFAERTPIVEFEKHIATAPVKQSTGTVISQIKAYQREHKCSFGEAADLFKNKNPEMFTEEKL